MSRYQLFEAWWKKATSGPGDFRINKRSAEIGFNAALDLSEQNSDSPASPVQQLKAKIAALANEVEGNPTSGYYGLSIAEIFERLRQLSAI